LKQNNKDIRPQRLRRRPTDPKSIRLLEASCSSPFVETYAMTTS